MANSRFGLRTRLGLVRSYTEGLGATDADATAFLNAAGITDATIIGAIQQLVIDLKLYSVWSKMKAIYPFVGGTASTHKWNLKDPQDTDGAYRLTFYGGWTHNSNGVTPNGSNAYADTFLNPNTVFSSNYASHGAYFRETFDAGQTNVFGVTNGTQRFDFGYDNGVLTVFNSIGSNNSDASSDSSNRGFVVATRQGASVVKLFRNNVSKISGTQSFVSYPAFNYFIGARNANGTAALFSNSKSIAFLFIGDSLTETDATNYNTAVNAFQTTVGRQI